MKFTNQKIYQLAELINYNLQELNAYIPAKANFFLQKNIATISNAAQDIEKARLEIAKHYGELNEEKQAYDIPQDKLEDASKELNELFNIEQELEIKTFSIDALGNVELTPAQMQTMMFMISEED